jgi:hypothetical protein
MFNGIECTFYAKNLYNDNLVLISSPKANATTGEVKKYVNTFISAINDLVEIGAISNERLEKYSTALSFLNAIKVLFNRGNPRHITIEMAKITIDVVKEISLLEIEGFAERTTVKAAAFAAKKLLDIIGD